jgi:2-polyprenyl-3-methyl-5-hydroxy-6-metoxy-1,4-benzoquinol methylase
MRLISRGALRSAEAVNALRAFINKALLFVNSFVAVILTPEEIASYTKQVYEDKELSPYGDRAWIEKGLNPSERDVLEKHAGRSGSFLVLGCGGGREAIALAKMGFDVTGIDASEKLILKAKAHIAREAVKVAVSRDDFLEMTFPKGGFDHCLITCFMYSAVPSRAMRVALLAKINDALTDRGVAIIHFATTHGDRSERLFKLRKAVARIFRGNVAYQTGDSFDPPSHFSHRFPDEREVIDEALEAGLSVKEILGDHHLPDGTYAILEKIRRQ